MDNSLEKIIENSQEIKMSKDPSSFLDISSNNKKFISKPEFIQHIHKIASISMLNSFNEEFSDSKSSSENDDAENSQEDKHSKDKMKENKLKEGNTEFKLPYSDRKISILKSPATDATPNNIILEGLNTSRIMSKLKARMSKVLVEPPNYNYKKSNFQPPTSVSVIEPIEPKRPLHFLKMIGKIQTIVKKMRTKSLYKPVTLARQKHLELINDISYIKEKTKTKPRIENFQVMLAASFLAKLCFQIKSSTKKGISMLKYWNRLLSRIFYRIPIVQPENFMKIIWDVIHIFCVVIFLFIYPIQISFDLTYNILEEIFYIEDSFLSYEVFFACMFAIDIMIKFTTAYYEKGLLVKDKHKIIITYLSKHFIYDIIGFSPVFIDAYIHFYPSFSSKYTKLAKFLIFFQVAGVLKSIRLLEEILHFSDKKFALLQLFKLAINIFLFCHFMACVWHVTSYYSPFDNSMLKAYNYYGNPWTSRYIRCLFFTVNFGRIDPQNDFEQFIGFFNVLATQGCMGFMISGIHNIMRVLSKHSETKRDIFRSLNKYFKAKKIDFDLQNKVRKFTNFLYDKSSEDLEIEKNLIAKLSNTLREEILVKAKGPILKSIPLFQKSFSDQTLKKLVYVLKQQRFSPEEVIFQEGDLKEGKNSLYLINDGEVEVFKGDKRQHKLAKLKNGDFFGEISFLVNCKQSLTVVSTSFSTIYMIDQADFLKIIKETPEDYETYCLIKDNINNYQNFNEIHPACHGCNIKGHFLEHCPRIHFIPSKNNILNKHLHYFPVLERSNYQRKITKFNSLTNKFYINLKAQSFGDEGDRFSDDSEIDSAEIKPGYGKLHSEKSGDEELDHQNNIFNSNIKNEPNDHMLVLTKKNNLDKLLNHLKTTIENKTFQDPKFALESNGNIKDRKSIEGNKIFTANLSSGVEIRNQNRLTVLESSVNIEKNQPMLKFDIFMLDFDVLKEFKFYFPDNNADNIIKLIGMKKSKKKMNKRSTINKSLSEKKKKTFRKSFFSPLGKDRNREKKQTQILGFIRKFL